MTTSNFFDDRPRAAQRPSVVVQFSNEIRQQIISLDYRFSRIRPVFRDETSNRVLYLRSRQEFLSRTGDRPHFPTDVTPAKNAAMLTDSPTNPPKTTITGCDRMFYKLLREKLLGALYGSSHSVKSLPQGLSCPPAQNMAENPRHALSISSITDSMKVSGFPRQNKCLSEHFAYSHLVASIKQPSITNSLAVAFMRCMTKQ